jgi:hypothetical protein
VVDYAYYAQAALREGLVFKINQSRAIKLELATLPASMALLAAQQVTEIRLRILETPKEVGWGDIAFEFALGFAINSSFVEKLTAKVFQSVFGSLLNSRAALATMPRSFFGSVVAQTKAVRSGANLPGALKSVDIFDAAAGKSIFDNLQRVEQVIATELAKYTKITPANKGSLKIYASGINQLIAEEKNASALLKGTKDAAKKGAPRSAPALATSDGSSVAVLEHFLAAASAQRLDIHGIHNAFELIARTLPLTEKTVGTLEAHFDLAQLLDVGRETFNLDQVGSSLRLRFEALIWAVHLGFSKARRTPDIDISAVTDYGGAFRPGLDERLVAYLFDRFGPIVEEYFRQKGINPASMAHRETTGSRANLLREYFWAITADLQ